MPPVALQPHSPAKKKPCHCNPNPHRPCTHTAVSTAKKAAAKAKNRATNAKVTAAAEKLLKAHPPTRAQIQQAVHLAAHPKPRSKAQLAAAKRAKGRVAAHKKITHKLHTTPKGPAPLPTSFLIAARKTVRAQMAAAAAKHKRHRRAVKATNPHTRALKRAKAVKC